MRALPGGQEYCQRGGELHEGTGLRELSVQRGSRTLLGRGALEGKSVPEWGLDLQGWVVLSEGIWGSRRGGGFAEG